MLLMAASSCRLSRSNSPFFCSSSIDLALKTATERASWPTSSWWLRPGMSIEVSLRASRSSAQPMPCRRASTRRSSSRPDGPDQQSGDGGGGAHPGDERARPRGHVVERRVRRERALLALGGERALQVPGRSRRTWRRAALACSGSRMRASSNTDGTLLLRDPRTPSRACARGRDPCAPAARRSRRCPSRRRCSSRALAAASKSRGRGGHQLALPLERGLRGRARAATALQRVLTDQRDRILGLAGKMDDAGRQQVDHGQSEGDGAVELGCDLRPRQPQPVEHGVPARRS